MDTVEIHDDANMNKNLTAGGLINRVYVQFRELPPKCVTVCLGLLCAVLLADASRHTPGDQMQANYGAERKQFEDGLNNLTQEKKQLEQSYTTLKLEKDQLQRTYSDLLTFLHQLQNNYSSLSISTIKLQTNYNSLQKEREQLQTNYDTLQKGKEHLQTTFNNLADVCVVMGEQCASTIKNMTAKMRNMLCQTGWEKLDTSCYFVSTEKKNWTSSRRDCIIKGANLVVIDNRIEQAFVNALLKSGQNAWIGLTDSQVEGTWMWVDGTKVTTTYWQDGQPNSHGGNQDCGEFLETSSGVGEWNDDACSAEQTYVCEL